MNISTKKIHSGPETNSEIVKLQPRLWFIRRAKPELFSELEYRTSKVTALNFTTESGILFVLFIIQIFRIIVMFTLRIYP